MAKPAVLLFFANTAHFLLDVIMFAISNTDGHKLLRGTGNPLQPGCFCNLGKPFLCLYQYYIKGLLVAAQGVRMLNTKLGSVASFPKGNLTVSLPSLDV